jgi:formylglycine-generating enzyme required for sulfatase activity
MALLIVVFDMWTVIRDSDLQMLQARTWICILLLVASAQPAVDLYAQNDPDTRSERGYERLGDAAVEGDFELDMTVPRSEEELAAEPKKAQLTQDQRISGLLAQAAAAMQAGRIDQPPRDCAWAHYRAALDLDPENTEAQQGLVAVQQVMVSRAIRAADNLDFESAKRILDDAALVTESPGFLEDSEEQIREIRTAQVEKIEVRAVTAMDAGKFTEAERALIELIALGGADSTVNQLRRRLEEARIYGGFKPGQKIRDHFINQGIWTPESVVVLAGSFMMGSSAFEDDRKDNEGPRHRVTIRRGFAIGLTEVTVKQFRSFVDKTGHQTDAERQGFSTIYNHSSGRLTERDDITWEMDYEGRDAEDDHPVVHVSWNDAMAYVRWLARGTGKSYRLPSEAEFEYALRAGRNARYPWGDGGPPRRSENLTGEEDVSRSRRQWSSYFSGYGDSYWGPAPVATFEVNAYGLHDIGGNVGEWTRDCWHDSYLRAPIDGSAWVNPGCKLRIVRGGYWASSPEQARSAHRLSAKPDRRDARIGFRIVRDL